MRGAGFRSRDILEPVIDPREVDPRRGGDMLQRGLAEPSVARTAQAMTANSLRQGAFDAGSGVVGRLTLLALDIVSGRLQRLMLVFEEELEAPFFTLGTELPSRTGRTVVFAKGDKDARTAGVVERGLPRS